jgi:hypothetical protein
MKKLAKTPAKIGRPTKRTKKLIDDLLEHVASGLTVRSFLMDRKIASSTFYSWVDADHRLSVQLARAKEIGCMTIEDEMMQIADSRDATDADDVQHRKVRLWMREKRLIWNNPERYGANSRVQVGGSVKHLVQLSDTERVVRIKQLLTKAQVEVEIDKEDADHE